MRQTPQHRRRREQFMTSVFLLAFKDTSKEVRLTPGAAPHGGDMASATLGTIVVTGRTVGQGFTVLFEDRLDHEGATGLAGVSTRWRDQMLHARSTSNVELLTQDDARRILSLGLATLA